MEILNNEIVSFSKSNPKDRCYGLKAQLLAICLLLTAISAFFTFGGEAEDHSEDRPSVPGDLNMAIITSEDLVDSFEPLRLWKSMTGIKTRIYVVDGEDSILSDQGADKAERLFNFIKYTYHQTEGNLSYVILGGDSEIVPFRYLHAGASDMGLDDRYVSDMYFSSPDTDWDADGDGRYGEKEDIDLIGPKNITFPVKVGRIPVNTPEEAGRYANRVVSYEKNPPEGDWTERAILSSTLMERPNILNDPDTPIDEGFDPGQDNGYLAMERLYSHIPSKFDVVDLHDYTQYWGMNYSRENDTFKYYSAPENISEGAFMYTFAGQSFYDIDQGISPGIAYSLAQWYAPSGIENGSEGFALALNYQDSYNLTNGDRLPMMYISSCDTFNFTDEQDRDLENILYAPEGGAISVVGSTGVSWRGEVPNYTTGFGNWYLLPRYWDLTFEDHLPGDSLYRLKESYLSGIYGTLGFTHKVLADLYTYNYFGDPSLRGWVGNPDSMTVYLERNEINSGYDTVSVSVLDTTGTPVYDARVSVYSDSTDQVFTSNTGPYGDATVECRFDSPGDATVTVTRKGRVPVVKNITLLEMAPDVAVVKGSLEITRGPLTEGENATVTFRVINQGIETIPNVKVGFHKFGWNGTQWPEPIMSWNLSLEAGVPRSVNFSVEPHRSWKKIFAFCLPVEGEKDLADNMISAEVSVNARPTFVESPRIEFLEDNTTLEYLDLSGSVFDPDNTSGQLRFWYNPMAPGWISVSESGLAEIRPPENWSGLERVEIFVSDGMAFDRSHMEVISEPVNDPPVIKGLQEKYVAYVDRPFTIKLDIRDAEGDSVSMDIESELENLTLTGDTLRVIPYSGDQGLYNVSVRLDDGKGGKSTFATSIEVKTADDSLFFREPSLYLPDAVEGERYEYVLRIGGELASDAIFSDNTTLFDVDPDTGRIDFTPDEDDVGEHWIKIEVDAGNATLSRSFVLEVEGEEELGSGFWIISGGIILVLIVLVIAAYAWKGAEVEQYGLEE